MVNLSTLTDRELTMLLGHALYMGHALRVAARAEQRARLAVGPDAREEAWDTALRWDAWRRHERKYNGTDFWPLWAPSRGPEWAHESGLDRAWAQPCFLSESARAEMHVPRR